MTIPTVPLLSALVLLDSRRWLAIALWAMSGSAAAGALFCTCSATAQSTPEHR
jgi:hypothetical protein